MQSSDHLTAGPLPHAPSCMSALEAILSSAYLAHSCAPAFKAAWQVVHAFAEARADGDALLRHLATSGTLAAALQSPLWAIEVPSVRPALPPLPRESPNLLFVIPDQGCRNHILNMVLGRPHSYVLVEASPVIDLVASCMQ